MQFNYEEMITRVATEANAVVPIVSFKEIAKQDWRKLPGIISSGLKTRASIVICTHFDQVGAFPNFPPFYFFDLVYCRYHGIT
jgi:hypothetical protein